jgi:thiol-disulfide isomerase/thioredoxin
MGIGRRRVVSFGVAGLLLLASVGSVRTPSVSARPAQRGAVSGDPPVIDLDGYRQAVARYRGKGVLATFWATWCQPCREEFPIITDLAKQYGPQGLVVVGVSLDEDADMGLVRKFLTEFHLSFPNYRQRPGIDADAFYQGVNPDWRGTMPQNDFYARDGHLARYFVGQKQRAAFEDAIRLILASPVSSNPQNKTTHSGN